MRTMDIKCPSCGRTYTLDKRKLRDTVKVRCECETVVDIYKAAVSPAAKKKYGPYETIRRLGMGGMGEIMLAKRVGEAGFESLVCLKKMLPHLSNDRQFISMLIQEAKLTVGLNHPNIVQIYDLGKEEGEYYIAMEYVEGTDLGRMIDACVKSRVKFPIQVAVNILIQGLRGLHYAHTRLNQDGEALNLIHRDITPQNVLLSPSGVAKLTDFGIAKAAGQISSTRPGMVKGKLGYIAPEQISGHKIDHRVDIFTSGILLWETLARKRLFKAVDMVDSFRLVMQCQIPSIRDFRPDVSRELDAVITKALSAKPDERFKSAGEFATELERVMMPVSLGEMGEATREFFAAHQEFFTITLMPQPEQTDAPTININIDIKKDASLDLTPATVPLVSEMVAVADKDQQDVVEPAPQASAIAAPSRKKSGYESTPIIRALTKKLCKSTGTRSGFLCSSVKKVRSIEFIVYIYSALV